MAFTNRDLHFTLHKICNDSETGKKVPYVMKEKGGRNNLSYYNTAGVKKYGIKLISCSETKNVAVTFPGM
jgi:hypothetical protein